MNPNVIAALVGAVAALIVGYIGYMVGERQHALDHDKWIADVVFKITPLGQPNSVNVIRALARSQALRDDAAVICRTFGVGPPDCPPLPAANTKR
jgi:hypothetical protein